MRPALIGAWGRGQGEGFRCTLTTKDWTLASFLPLFSIYCTKDSGGPVVGRPLSLQGPRRGWGQVGGRWPCSSSLYPPVKSFLTCLPERLRGLTSPYPALRGKMGNSIGLGVLQEPCHLGYVPGGSHGQMGCKKTGLWNPSQILSRILVFSGSEQTLKGGKSQILALSGEYQLLY